MDHNYTELIGRLTAAPEVTYSDKKGTAVAKMTVAVTTKYRSGEETKRETLFMSVVIFGKDAENAGTYLEKGQEVLVAGRLRERHWESEGVRRSKFELVGEKIKYGAKPKRSNGGVEESSDIADGVGAMERDDKEPF